MKNTIFLSAIVLSFVCYSVHAQKVTISGQVKNLLHQRIPDATVLIKQLNKAVTTNDSGNFTMSVRKGKFQLFVLHSAYNDYAVTLEVDTNVYLDVVLTENVRQLEEVKIEGRANNNITLNNIGVMQVDIKQMKQLPAVFGQVDVVKNIQMMPGVQSAGEGSPGFYVRGGSADQNLLLLDHAPVYYTSHIFGLFSVFNADILKSVTLYKGGIPVEFGGKLSSVTDIRTKTDTSQKVHGNYTTGTGIYQFSLYGSLKRKTKYMISARRSILDLYQALIEAINPKVLKSRLYFYDVNFRLDHQLNTKDKISFSFYRGKDYYNINDLLSSYYSNSAATLEWKHSYNGKLQSNTCLIYSNFRYKSTLQLGIISFEQKNGMEEIGLKHHYGIDLGQNHKISSGISGTYRVYSPGEFVPASVASMFKATVLPQLYSGETAFYINNAHTVSSKLLLEYGLRFSVFSQLGKGEQFRYNGTLNVQNIIDTMHFQQFEPVKVFTGAEPRISGRYLINQKNSIKFSFDRMIQYMHFMSNATSPVPENIWVPSNNYLIPQKCDQISAGYFRNFLENSIEVSFESYYKMIRNVVDFKDHAQLDFNPALETEVRRGVAWAYGAELLMKGRFRKINTTLSYTWSKSQMKVDEVNQGRTYYANHDRRNNINFLCSYDLADRWNIAANFTYATGRAITLPAAKYQYSYVTASYYTERNGYRMPDFHHFDVAVNYFPKRKLRKRTLIKIPSEKHVSFSVYNIYGRKNPYLIYTREVRDAPGQREVVMIYLFRWFPSVSVEYKF